MSESSSLTVDQIGPIHGAVITHAHDPHDAALLLDVLGLTEETL